MEDISHLFRNGKDCRKYKIGKVSEKLMYSRKKLAVWYRNPFVSHSILSKNHFLKVRTKNFYASEDWFNRHKAEQKDYLTYGRTKHIYTKKFKFINRRQTSLSRSIIVYLQMSLYYFRKVMINRSKRGLS